MERLRERIQIARKALASLRELDELPFSKLLRDAAIQRFEYSFEAVWKAVQRYLKDIEGMDVGSPKGVARASLRVGLLTAEQTRSALVMTDDRNLTVHTYNEPLADAIYSRIAGYIPLLDEWLGALERRLEELAPE